MKAVVYILKLLAYIPVIVMEYALKCLLDLVLYIKQGLTIEER